MPRPATLLVRALAVWIVFVVAGPSAFADGVLYVKASAAPGGDGSSWGTAYQDLNLALSAARAAPGRVMRICVAEGTYRPAPEGGSTAASFTLVPGAQVIGGYAGHEASDAPIDPDAHPTILSGELGDPANPDDNTRVLVEAGANTTLVGFTIRDADKGAILRGAPWVQRCQFNFNRIGIEVADGSPSLAYCTLAGNRELGARLSAPKVVIERCTFSDNAQGGLEATTGEVELNHCVFERNRGLGGCSVPKMNFRAVGCLFRGNAGRQGGALVLTNKATLINCAFAGNSATQSGGAVYAGPDAVVINCTFVNNTAGAYGGGLAGALSTSRVANCIFWGNRSTRDTSRTAEQISSSTAVPLVVHSCIEGGWNGPAGFNNLAVDPGFVDLTGPDGQVGTADDNLQLRPGSPCIDAGDSDLVPASGAVDQGYGGRFIDVPAAPNVLWTLLKPVDIGAYEAAPYPGFVVQGEPVHIQEGAIRTLTVALSSDPGGEVTATAVLENADPDLVIVSAASLAFNSFNYSTPRKIVLSAAADADRENGTAQLRLSAPGFADRLVNVAELDPDGATPATILRVDGRVGSDGDGSSWPNAFKSIQTALAVAAAAPKPVEIWVAEGRYTPAAANGDRSASFALVNQVALYGGFAGGEEARPSRDPAHRVTILSGDLNGDDGAGAAGTGENSYHVVTAEGVDRSAILDGFLVSGGNANSPQARDKGAGLQVYSGSPTVTHCVFTGNRGSSVTLPPEFGAIANAGDLLLTNCRIYGNACMGVSNRTGGLLAVINCTITGNADVGIYTWGRLSVLNSTIAHNYEYGIASYSTPVLVYNSVLWGNRARYAPGDLRQTSTPPLAGYSCIQGWITEQGGIGNTAADPQFVDPDGADGILGTADDDWSIPTASPCMDSANNGRIPADLADLDDDGLTDEPLPQDIAGQPRRLDDPGKPDGGRSDAPVVNMGAYESAPPAFLIEPGLVEVPEGGGASFTVALTVPPPGELNVTVSRKSGSNIIAVESGGTLQFNASNFTMPQAVTLVAAEDANFTVERASFQVVGAGYVAATVPAQQIDNEQVPAVIYVSAAATGANTGLSWADAFTELRDALAAAANRTEMAEIWVARGRYAPSLPGTFNPKPFNLISGVSLYGGFAGTETTREQSDPEANETILDGENRQQVVSTLFTSTRIALDGFTITRGYAERGAGGTFYNGAFVSRCRFVGNRCYSVGGAAEAGGNTVFSRCTFIENKAEFEFGKSAFVLGGAITAVGDLVIEHCRFLGNQARADHPDPRAGDLEIYGGAIEILVGRIRIADCDFSGNSVFARGGRSRSAQGGALGVIDVPHGLALQVVNCTFSGNSSNMQGGGMWVKRTPAPLQGAELAVYSCIFWGNMDASGSGPTAQFDFTGYLYDSFELTHSCIAGLSGQVASGNIGADPLFVDADGADNTLGTLDDDLRLQPGSPAIDAGDNAVVPAGLLIDLGGWPRFVDDPATPDTGAGSPPIVDMGAHEYHPVRRADVDRDGDLDRADAQRLFECLTGPAVPIASETCGSADIDADHDVDQEDFGVFQRCFSGPDTMVSASCSQ